MTPPQPSLRTDGRLYLVFAVTLMAVLGVSSITPAFPRIIEGLGIDEHQVGLLITVFTLPGVALTLVFGVLADRFGRRRILVPLLLLFGLAGGGCLLAERFETLLVLRFVQGIGAAGIGSLNITLIGDFYEARARSTVMGYNSTVLSLGTASYPALGGLLASLDWHFVFLLPLFALPIGIWAAVVLPKTRPGNPVPMATYLRDTLRILRSPRVATLVGAGLVIFLILYGAFLNYYPILIHQKFAGSTVVIGLVMSSASIFSGIASTQMGRLAARWQPRGLVCTAFLLYSVSMIAVPFAPDLLALLAATALFGAAMGISIPAILNELAGSAPTENRAMVMAANGMALRLGQTLGPLATGLIFDAVGLTAVFISASGLAFVVFAGLALSISRTD